VVVVVMEKRSGQKLDIFRWRWIGAEDGEEVIEDTDDVSHVPSLYRWMGIAI
jgi:hypothetical protein